MSARTGTVYLDWALASTGPNGEHLAQKELVVIRWACWLAEAIAIAVSRGTTKELDVGEAMRLIEQLSDEAEHVAQFALAGEPVEWRSQNLCAAVAKITAWLDSAEPCLGKMTYLPSREALQRWVR